MEPNLHTNDPFKKPVVMPPQAQPKLTAAEEEKMMDAAIERHRKTLEKLA
jgi:hypothetical protein